MNKKNVGATLTEYALLLALIVAVAMGAISLLGERVAESYCNSSAAFEEESSTGSERIWGDGECVLITEEIRPDCTEAELCI